MAAYQVTADDFEGMTCNVYKPKGSKDKSYSDIYHDDSLVCVEGPNSTTTDRDGFVCVSFYAIIYDVTHTHTHSLSLSLSVALLTVFIIMYNSLPS